MAEEIIKITLEDVGTRYKHLSDLLELWELGLEVLNRQTYKSDLDDKRIANLEAGIALLRKQIEVMADYNNKQWVMREEINRIPRIEKDQSV